MDITSYLLGKQAGGGGSSTLQNDKEVTVTSNGTSVITPDSGYDGVKKVSLTTNVQPNLESKSVTISSNTTTNITPTSGKDGLSSVSVTTNVQPNLQTKNLTIDENGTITVTPDSGYDGIGSIVITTNVSGGGGVDEYTQLLLHFDGNYADSSQYSRVPSATGNTINYGAGKFDTSLNATTNQQGIITYSQLSDLVTHDFTIDFWFYPNSFATSGSGNGRPIIGAYQRNNWAVLWRVFVSEYQGNTKKWGFGYADGTNTYQLSSTTELTQNAWQHLAVTYDSSTKKMALYLNGVKDAEDTLNFTMQDAADASQRVLSVGNWFSTQQYQPNGYIDEVRVSNVVRYTENFTPPTAPY
jgi:hypothetical protein